MKRRRRSLSPRMRQLATLYGRAQRWPCSFMVDGILVSVSERGNVFKAVNPRYYDLTAYWPPIAT